MKVVCIDCQGQKVLKSKQIKINKKTVKELSAFRNSFVSCI